MEWNNLDITSDVVNFSRQKPSEHFLSGVLRCGNWAWFVDDNTLQIIALKSGQIVSSYTFSRSIYNCNGIVNVEEIVPKDYSRDMVLAVCLDCLSSDGAKQPVKSIIAIYSVACGRVLDCIELQPYVTCMKFIPSKNCRRSFFERFDGCLAIGVRNGLIFVIDLYLNYLLEAHEQQRNLNANFTLSKCHFENFTLPTLNLQQKYKSILRERNLENLEHFGVQLEAFDVPCRVETFLPIDVIIGLAAGFEDGHLVIYDLLDMRIVFASMDHEQSSLLHMDYLEPPDDPQPCFYILTLHGTSEKLITSLFVFMYENRITENCDIYFEVLKYAGIKMNMVLESDASVPISCQAITKAAKSADDDAMCLFAISWNSLSKKEIKLLFFDINQWYKAEMPGTLSKGYEKSCLAAFKIYNRKHGLDAFVNPATISHFNSMQRCEEHFYPNSFSFDWMLIDIECCRMYNWPGVQNKVVNVLRLSNASLFLEPDAMFEKLRQAHLMPQFMELNINALFSQNAKIDVLLSVALEYNCMGLLRDCASSWADGSFTGNSYLGTSVSELSLQTLKNWIWKRASLIKRRCNELCQESLCSRGHPLDQREKKELGYITRQLRNLAELYDEVMHQFSKSQDVEKFKDSSIHLAADYQELLIWSINIGLFSTTSHPVRNDDMPGTSKWSIYPYEQLREYYDRRRSAFAKIDDSYISKKSGSCRLLFIDAFIEHECMGNAGNTGKINNDNIREQWLQNNGNGLYPPANIDSMLRIMLLSNVGYESKCAILLYFFLDLHVALTDGDRHDGGDLKDIVQNFLKFPSIFKLSPSLTKTLQAFWHLDHENNMAAVDEFLSPFNNNRQIDQWLIELLVESLLLQNAANLALRIFHVHSSLVSPSLELSTLLANDLIAEGFHFVRSKNDTELMKRFFTTCLRMGKLGVVTDLALNDYEGKLVVDLLKNIKLPGAENLHFVYLLQKSKYIEAVSYMDELAKEKGLRYNGPRGVGGGDADSIQIDTPDLVISAFNTTMAPVTQSLTDIFFRIKNRVKRKETQNRSPVPLSCQLIKQNANNLLGGIYHSSALSAHFASLYYDEELQYGRSNELNPLTANNAPFLRKAQTEKFRDVVNIFQHQTMSYPTEFKPKKKRQFSEIQNDMVDIGGRENLQQLQPASKKRRLIGEDFLTGFKHLQQMKVFNETSRNFLSEGFQDINKGKEIEEQNHPSVKSIASNELHSILKSCTPEPTEFRLKKNETPGVEEKTLRFALPINENKTRNISNEIEIVNEVEANSEPQIKHRVVTRSISEEDSQEENVDVTQYYSTLSTQGQKNSSTSGATVSSKDSGISIASKPLEAQEQSDSIYQSAISKSFSSNVSGPKPRKSLRRVSVETEQEPQKQQTLESEYMSIERTSTSCEVDKNINKETSDEDPIIFKPPFLKISSVTTLSSVEFTPQICSSKVGATQSKVLAEDLKISERSTIVMTSASVCDMDLPAADIEIKPEIGFIQPKSPLASNEENQNENMEKQGGPFLDTTLGMSSCELTDLETTALESDNELKSSDNLQLLQTSSDPLIGETSNQTNEGVNDGIASKHSEEIIELLSSADENDVQNENESTDCEINEGSSEDSEIEVESISEETGNTNQDSSNSDEIDSSVEVGSVEGLSTSESSDIVLKQDDSVDSENENTNDTNNEQNSKSPLSNELFNPVETESQSQNDQKLEATTTEQELPLITKTESRNQINEDVEKPTEEQNVLNCNEEANLEILVSPNSEGVEKIKQAVEELNETGKPIEDKNLQKPEDILNIQQYSSLSSNEDAANEILGLKSEDLLETSEVIKETTMEVPPNVERDLNTSEQFETPNASMNSVKLETSVKNIDRNISIESMITDHTDDLHLVESSTHSTKKRTIRGQSAPLEPLKVNEDLEADSKTPRTRRKRGISVPPQTIDSALLTPTGRQKATSRKPVSSVRRKNSIEEESPQSPNSSRGSHPIRSFWDSGSTPQVDSPALHTRSRTRRMSENSDATATSINSPAASLKRVRRTSITSSRSEQLQETFTPKRTRRSSVSAQSDKEGTPRKRRLLIKEVEDAENREEETPTPEPGIDLYSSARRLTRTQRALLAKSEQLTNVRENLKDDQASVSSQVSNQTSIRSKRRSLRSGSIRSHDEDDDDRTSGTSSVGSEMRRTSQRLRAQQQQQQQQNSPHINLTSIPEDETEEGEETHHKRNKPVKK